MKNTFLKMAIIVSVIFVIVNVTLVIADGVQVNITKADDIDVALSTGTTEVEVNRFERDLKQALEDRDIDESRVNVQAFDAKTTSTETQDASEIFADWESRTMLPNNSITDLRLGDNVDGGWIADASKVIREEGNTRPARAWINPEPVQTDGGTDFSFIWGIEDDKDKHGSFEHGEAGFIFGIEDDKNFYVYIMDNHDACGHIRVDGGEAIIKVKDGKFSGGTKGQLSKSLASSESFPMYRTGLKQDINISIRNNEITVTRKGEAENGEYEEVVLEAVDEEVENIGGSYGFYVWDQYGAYFDNIGFTVESKREFNEVIRQPEWRDNSKRFIVNMEDEIQEEFNDEKKMGEILSRLINEKIDYIGVGSNKNESQANELISKNNENGKFINSSIDYDEIINQIADRIVSQLDSGNEEQYVIVGDKYDFKVSPEDILTGTQNSEYPDGRWKVEHEYNFYENGSGRHELDGKYFPDFDINFDKPGRYRILFEKSSTFPEYIKAHRRPIASYSIDVTKDGNGYKTNTNDFSYDPDRESESNKGIIEHEWKWMETGASKWNYEKLPSKIDKDKDYIIQLRVKDEQNVWSDPMSRYITTSEGDSQPIANFDMPLESLIYDEVNIKNTSYDPAGKKITAEEWIVTKNGVEQYKGNEPLVNFNEYGDGRYIVSLKVKNDKTWSETFSRVINITKDNISPDISVDKDNVEWTNSVINVKANFNDDGGSGFKEQRFAITGTSTKPQSGWSSWSSSKEREIDIIQEGHNYIHIEATDNEDNLEYKSFGPYKFDKTNPTVSIKENDDREPHENVVLEITASDTLSRVKSITYLGENMVENGDFSEGNNHWKSLTNGVGESNVSFHEGIVKFNEAGDGKRNRIYQRGEFIKDKGVSKHYAKVIAKGEGNMNVRYGDLTDRGNGVPLISNNNFNEYNFTLSDEDEERPSSLVVLEIVGHGQMEVKSIKVYEQKDITDTKKLEVTQNGTYEFVVEDNAGNITAKSYEVDSIVRELSMDANSDDINMKTTIGSNMNLKTSINDMTITDWRDTVDNNWQLTLSSDRLKGENELPVGTINFSGVDKVNKVDGANSNEVSSEKRNVAIDDGAVSILEANDERGVYEIKFNKDALRFNFVSNQVKKGNYKTKLTWTLENTLKAK